MAQGFVVVANQGFLLGARPAFELGFAAAGLRESAEGFESKQGNRCIDGGGPACPTRGVIHKTLVQVGRAAGEHLDTLSLRGGSRSCHLSS
jgi:hypothetical protein